MARLPVDPRLDAVWHLDPLEDAHRCDEEAGDGPAGLGGRLGQRERHPERRVQRQAVQIDPDRMHALGIGNAQGDDHAPKQPPIALDEVRLTARPGADDVLRLALRRGDDLAFRGAHRVIDAQRFAGREQFVGPAVLDQQRCRDGPDAVAAVVLDRVAGQLCGGCCGKS